MFRKNLNSCVRSMQSTYRFMSSELKTISMQYCKHGDPMEVLQLMECKIKAPEKTKVLVKILAAPITSADVATIQGKSQKPKKLPATAGHECVAEVVCVGESVKTLKPGERVVPSKTGLGTWTTLAVWDEADLRKISNKIGLSEAASLGTNPITAYSVLKSFAQLKEGDTVIINDVNSPVGQTIQQLCKAWKIKLVTVIPDGPDAEKLKTELKCNGGVAEVFTEKELNQCDVFQSGKLNKPKLALNGIGGKSTIGLAKQLDKKGVLVTYGGSSKAPVIGETGTFMSNDISFRGFSATKEDDGGKGGEGKGKGGAAEEVDCKEQIKKKKEQEKMMCEIMQMLEKGVLKAPPHEMVPMLMYKKGAASALCKPKKGSPPAKMIFLNMTC